MSTITHMVDNPTRATKLFKNAHSAKKEKKAYCFVHQHGRFVTWLLRTRAQARPVHESLRSLSKGVFERRTSKGREAFSLVICVEATTFLLLSVFPPTEMIFLKHLGKNIVKECKKSTSGYERRQKRLC